MESPSIMKMTQNMTITGLIILILGFVTFTPEIFFPGLLVLLFSGVKGVEALEKHRIVTNQIESPSVHQPNLTDYAW